MATPGFAGTEEEALAILRAGTLRPLGQMHAASNATLLCELTHDDVYALAVYKPRDGEAPLWDFPEGTLCLREVAAYEVSSASGWDLVPPTVLRGGPYGIGAVQAFVDAEPGEHYLTLGPGREEVFTKVAAFDIAINNADRKSGHCLLERFGSRVWVVDHGLAFHPSPKLRTVIWEYEGEELAPDVVEGLLRVERALDRAGSLARALSGLIDPTEIDAMSERVSALLRKRHYPGPGPGRPYPWPPI